MELAKNVAIDGKGLAVNGLRFPFYVAEEISVHVEDPALSFVSIRIPTETVTIGPGVEVEEDGSVLIDSDPPAVA